MFYSMFQAHGIIFVVDASASDRVDEAKDVLNSVIQHEKVGGKPLLVFANKQDQDGAIDESELGSQLQLDTLMGDNRLYTNVVSAIYVSMFSLGLVSIIYV